jgi:LysR family nitrogen assimilation transcriptional regulator
MREQLGAGILNARRIVEPELLRTLHFCHLADRPATYLVEAMRHVLKELILAEVASGGWPARALNA